MKRIIMASITAVVVVAVLAGTLIPILDDATATTDTFVNTGSGSFSYLTSEDEYTYTWDYTNPTKVTVNGVEMSATAGSNIVCMDDDFCIRAYANNTGYIQFIGSNLTAVTSSVSAQTNFSLTYSDGNLTVTNGTITTTTTSDGFYALVPTGGAYTMKSSTSAVYLSTSDPLIVMGITTLDSQLTGFKITGTVDDYEVQQWVGSNVYTLTNIDDDATLVDGYKDLYSLKAFTWDATYSDSTTAVTYNYFLVPIEVVGEKAVHFTDGENAIFNAIPVMIIIALLLGVVALVLRSRMD